MKPTLSGEWAWLAALGAIALVSTGAAIVAGALAGIPTLRIYAGYVTVIWGVVPAVVTLALGLYLIAAAARREPNPLGALRPFALERMGTVERAAGTLGPILLLPLILGAFGTLKQVLPLLHPFSWDSEFARIGLLLTNGTRSWRITHALFGSPEATLVLDRLYSLWMPLNFIVVLGVALFAAREIRARFFLAFGASWILLGVVAAFLFSSAGPCYAAYVHSDAAPSYAQLMARLHAIDAAGYRLDSLAWQEYLWRAQVRHEHGFALGVSAMPSMHNAIAFLYVLAAREAARPLRLATWAFAVAIFIGSIHLGWHYMVDGLTAWIGMAFVWEGAGAYLRWCRYGAAADEGDSRVVPFPGARQRLPRRLAA